MIWSSRARNRSFEPVVLCFFGRIVRPPIGRENHASLLEGIAKSNLQGSDAQSTKTLQSQTHLPTRMRFQISRLAVLHGRRRIDSTPQPHPGGALGRNQGWLVPTKGTRAIVPRPVRSFDLP